MRKNAGKIGACTLRSDRLQSGTIIPDRFGDYGVLTIYCTREKTTMNATQLVKQIAGRLSGIAMSDLTTAERQIAQLLIENGQLKIWCDSLIDNTHPQFNSRRETETSVVRIAAMDYLQNIMQSSWAEIRQHIECDNEALVLCDHCDAATNTFCLHLSRNRAGSWCVVDECSREDYFRNKKKLGSKARVFMGTKKRTNK